MAFNEIELHRIKKEVGGLCRKRSPEALKDQLRFDYKIEKYNVIIYEIRPRWTIQLKSRKCRSRN